MLCILLAGNGRVIGIPDKLKRYDPLLGVHHCYLLMSNGVY